MVKIVRVICITLCIITSLIFCGMTINSWRTTDNVKPVITMEESHIVISINDGEEAILRGITAIDEQDGDVTDRLLVETLGNFSQNNVREATIAAFDKAGNVTKVTRQVSYSDYTPPRVTLTGPLSVGLNRNQLLLSRIHVYDCLDGDISDSVLLTLEGSHSNTTQVLAGGLTGAYAMRLQFSNSAGDTINMPVTVEFFNTSEAGRPDLSLKEYILYVPVGTEIDPVDYLDSLTIYSRSYTWKAYRGSFIPEDDRDYEPIPGNKIQIVNNMDSSTPGVYEILYSYTSEEGYKGSVRLIVVVEE